MPLPFVSLIIPTYDRRSALRACLQSVTELAYPTGALEVVVVDDGSPQPIERDDFPFQKDVDLTLVRQENAGPAAARNTGAQRAHGDLLAFTDDDCQPTGSWLRRLVESQQSTPGAMVGGKTLNALPENPYSTVSELLVRFLRRHHAAHTGRGAFFASNNLIVPADRFREIGGFDTRFPLAAGEDRDLCLRWTDRGFPTAYTPDAIVHHAHALTLRRFLLQHYTYGRGAFHVQRKHASARVLPQPASFYRALLTYPLREHPDLRGGCYALLMALAQGATALGYASEATRHSC